jgi:hypothetical protein
LQAGHRAPVRERSATELVAVETEFAEGASGGVDDVTGLGPMPEADECAYHCSTNGVVVGSEAPGSAGERGEILGAEAVERVVN